MDIVHRLDRMKVLFELALIQAPEETIYNRITLLASEVIKAPVSLVSMVALDYQFFKSQVGLPDPWKSERRTPLSHSFCQHVMNENKPLIVTDARENDLLKTNLAIRDLDVIAYLGIPLVLEDKIALGSFCVIDSAPREWEAIDIQIMTALARMIGHEFDTRADAKRGALTQDALDELHQKIIAFAESIDTTEKKSVIYEAILKQNASFGLN